MKMKMELYQIREMVTQSGIETRMVEALRAGCLPDCFLYTNGGADNWLRLDASRDFPIARRLTDLLKSRAESLAELIPPDSSFLSIGIGSGEKERILLQHLAHRESIRFYAADISRRLVEIALENFRLAGLPAYGIVAFLEDIALLLPRVARPHVLCLLGNTFCNYNPEDLLRLVHRHLSRRGLFLFDCHLCTSQMDFSERVYQSPLNIAFNLGPLLNGGMTAEDFHFTLKMVPVAHARLGTIWKTRKSVRVLRSGTLRIGRETLALQGGQELRMGFTYLFTQKQIDMLLRQGDFAVVKQILSPDREEMILLIRKK